MSEDLIARWLDDRASLSEEEAAELHRLLSSDPALAQQVKDQLATDELVSRRLAVDRRNFENQVAQRIVGAGSDGTFMKSTLQAVSDRGARRFSWRARLPEAAAAAVLIAGLFLLLRQEQAVQAPAAPPLKRGLKAQYYQGRFLQGVPIDRIDATVDYSWSAGQPPISTTKDVFSVRWTGKILPRFTERYTFHARYDDGVRVWLDGRIIHDDWNGRYSIVAKRFEADLVANKPVDVKIEYFNGGDRGVMQLSWSSKSQPEEVIPETALSHE